MLLQNSSKARWYSMFFFGIQTNKNNPLFPLLSSLAMLGMRLSCVISLAPCLLHRGQGGGGSVGYSWNKAYKVLKKEKTLKKKFLNNLFCSFSYRTKCM
jgi:hypothetical protein